MPEISDADFELLKLSKAALGGKTRLKTLRVFKEAAPETVLPELDTDDRIQEAVNPLLEENKKLRAEIDNDKTARTLEQKRTFVKSKGLKVEDVEKVMIEKGINSHESAVEFIEANSRVAAPSTPSVFVDRTVEVPKADFVKTNAGVRGEAAKILAEIRAAK